MTALQYRLEPAPDAKAAEFLVSSIERSYRTQRIDIAGPTLTVAFEEHVSPEAFGELMHRLLYASRSVNEDTLFVNQVEHPYDGNPMADLLSSGDVIPIADGVYAFQGRFWEVFQALNKYVRTLAHAYDAVEQEYPALWPIDLYRRINYFREFPQQVILATTARADFRSRESFARSYDNTHEYEAVQVIDHMADCRYGLQPAVCDMCYYILRDSTNHPNTIYTTYNKVFRNESSKRQSLDRLTAFSVRDIMFVGDTDFVSATRRRLVDDMIGFLRLLDIDCRIESANDPFFANDSTMKSVFQNASRLKYELLARLNYTGEYIAVGSINNHLDFFGKAFNIRLPDGAFSHSGCVGVGFERLTFALYCQYGTDVAAWPEGVQRKLGLA